MSKASEPKWAELLMEANKLKREDKLLLIKSLAGTAGMIACFPNQMVGNQQNSTPNRAKAPFREEKKRKESKTKVSNPLHGTEIAKAFNEAKKAVRTAKKVDTVEPSLLATLAVAKKAYFETLAKAKEEIQTGTKGSGALGDVSQTP